MRNVHKYALSLIIMLVAAVIGRAFPVNVVFVVITNVVTPVACCAFGIDAALKSINSKDGE